MKRLYRWVVPGNLWRETYVEAAWETLFLQRAYYGKTRRWLPSPINPHVWRRVVG